jgi:hypothetical protein
MNKNKNLIVILIIVLLLSVCGVGLYFGLREKEPKIIRMEGDFAIDMSDKNQVVGSSDYVFVGYVNKLETTIYKYDSQSPYTIFNVRILKNIKGNLKLNIDIPIQKDGGIAKDKKSIDLYENDVLPEQNKTYVFIAYAQSDGSLLLSGPASNIILEESVIKSVKNNMTDFEIVNEKLENSAVIDEYTEAFVNQVNVNRPRYLSAYDDGN